MVQDDKPYTVERLAERWKCSEGAIRNKINRGELNIFRIGSLIRIPAAEVARLDGQFVPTRELPTQTAKNYANRRTAAAPDTERSSSELSRDDDQDTDEAGARGKIRLRDMPDWPAGLSFNEALAYTGLGASVIEKAEAEGCIRFLRIGANGRKIAPRADLDRLLDRLFAGKHGILGDMDFGDGAEESDSPRRMFPRVSNRRRRHSATKN